MNKIPTPAKELDTLLARLSPGEPFRLGELTMVPLLAGEGGPDADLLEEGLARQVTEVTEISAEGSVNQLRVLHRGERPLLLLDSEEVVGAKQNRIFNASFLVLPGTSVIVPVSCVEQGRWNYTSSRFSSSNTVLTSVARSGKLRRVAASVASSGRYDSNQGEVWREVGEYATRSGVQSRTRAFADTAQHQLARTADAIRWLEPRPGQVGLAAVHGRNLVGLDVFGSQALFQRAWQKLARGLLAEVYEQPGEPANGWGIVARLLLSLKGAPLHRRAAPGCGETLHGTACGVAIGAIAHGGQVYHAVMSSLS